MRLLRFPARLAVALIRLYQLTIGRMIPPRCRFHPSCSEYAAQTISADGLIRGGFAASWRIVRCGPWSRGGLDPVRPRRAQAAEAPHG